MGAGASIISRPREITLAELVDIQKDGKFTLKEGCGPRSPWNTEWELKNRGFKYPENGEFVFTIGDEQCGLCATEYGNDCGNSGLVGDRGGVKRVAYNGDQTRCCMANIGGQNTSKIDTTSNTTCLPNDYTNPASSYCSNTYTDYCVGSNIVDDSQCKKLSMSNATLYNKLMSSYCNENDSNAHNTTCIDWCTTNSCPRLNNSEDCKRYGISEEACTSQAALDIKTKCLNYGMLSTQGLPVGNYKCTQKGLTDLEQDCKDNGIPLTTCNANKLDNAYSDNLAKKLASAAQEQSDAQFKVTQDALSQVLGLPQNQTTTESSDQTQTYIIIAIIILIICMSSVSSLVGGYFAFNE
jgi:hypothetical protein